MQWEIRRRSHDSTTTAAAERSFDGCSTLVLETKMRWAGKLVLYSDEHLVTRMTTTLTTKKEGNIVSGLRDENRYLGTQAQYSTQCRQGGYLTCTKSSC